MKPKSRKISTGDNKGVLSGVTMHQDNKQKFTPEVIENIKKDYLDFIKVTDYDKLISNQYESLHRDVIKVQVFSCNPFGEAAESKIINPFSEDGKYKKTPVLVFPICRVVTSPSMVSENMEHISINQGDIVTMRDWDVATLINPHYEVYNTAIQLNRTNATVSSSMPEKFVNNISHHARSMFFPNKLDLRTQFTDKYYFDLTLLEVKDRIKNPKQYADEFISNSLERLA